MNTKECNAMCSTVMYVLICVCLSYSALCLLECSFATILSHIFVCLCAYVSVCLFVIVMRIYVCLSSLCNIPTSCKDSINVLVCIMERSCLPVCLSVFVPVPVCIGLSACLFLFSYPSHLPLPHYRTIQPPSCGIQFRAACLLTWERAPL